MEMPAAWYDWKERRKAVELKRRYLELIKREIRATMPLRNPAYDYGLMLPPEEYPNSYE